MGRLLLASLLLVSIGFSACRKSEEPIEKGKILIFCDDWNVQNWILYRDSFTKYQIKLTMYVSHFHQMDSHRRAMLRTMVDDGHEFAFHTLHHPQWNKGASIDELNAYLHTEIDSGLALVRAASFEPKCFAFPHDWWDQPVYDSLLTRFKHVRKGNFGFSSYGQFGQSRRCSTGDLWCIATDNAYSFEKGQNWNEILNSIDEGQDMAFLFHSLSDGAIDYTTKPDLFFELIRELKSRNLEFVSLSDYAGLR